MNIKAKELIMENDELKDFIISEEENKENTEYNIVSSTDEIDNFDFSSDDPFDIERSHELIVGLKRKEESDDQKELIKLQEAKNIIDKTAKQFLNEEFVDSFNKEEENLLNMIKKYDPNKDIVRNMNEKQKDQIYDIAQYLFNSYQKKLNIIEFLFPLTQDEVKFIFDVFRHKLEYDQNEVFQLRDLKENYLDRDFGKMNEEGLFVTRINVNDLIVFYHLISKYKVKGITKEHYNFLEVLTKIGERIKLFNAYNVIVQRLSNDFQLWGGNLTVETSGSEISGQVVEPQILNDVTASQPLNNLGISIVNEETGEAI